MTSADSIIRREIESDEAKIRRAVERGGLPTEAEVGAVYDALTDAGEQLEALAWRIEGIALSDVGEDVPEVTLEQLGVLATLASDTGDAITTLTGMHQRIAARTSSLLAIRAEQQSSKRGDDA
jgi:hypothetical protein